MKHILLFALTLALPAVADIGVINTGSMRSGVLYAEEGKVFLKECIPAVAEVTRSCQGKILNSVAYDVFFSEVKLSTGNLSKIHPHESIAFAKDVVEKARVENQPALVEQYEVYLKNLETLLVIGDALEGATEWKIYSKISDARVQFKEILFPFDTKGYECRMNFRYVSGYGGFDERTEKSYGSEKEARENLEKWAKDWAKDAGPITCSLTAERQEIFN